MRKTRRFFQIFFFLLFCWLMFLANQQYIKGYPVTLFLDASALNGLGALLAGANVAHLMWIGFFILALSFIFGRFFCGWICPMGTIMDAISFIFRPGKIKDRIEKNKYSPKQIYKYMLLIIILISAAMGVMQAGLLDPISILTRTGAVFFAPAISDSTNTIIHNIPERTFPIAPLIVGFFAFLLWLNIIRPRFWCRYICPLGALLGAGARFAPKHIVRDKAKCTDCGLCTATCTAAASPQKNIRTSECWLCHNCIEECPENALTLQWDIKTDTTRNERPDLLRRKLLTALIGGITAGTTIRIGGSLHKRGYPQRIRPPGSLLEKEFLARCLKCDACVKICPTNVIQPAITEAGLEGFMTPVLDMQRGYCEYNCTLCGQVCPSGAIERITIAQKHGIPDGKPIKIGTAFIDKNRCIPWTTASNCLVCQEVCPTSPKAIMDDAYTTMHNHQKITTRRPLVNPELCIGCGLCQHECPVYDSPAIQVTAINESRDLKFKV